MPNVKQAAAEFLANKRIAVTGVSRNPKGGHGSNIVYQRLRQRGYQVFAVNPNADTVEGDRCYHDLGSIPGGVDGGCPLMFDPTADFGHKAMRVVFTLTGNVPGRCEGRRVSLARPQGLRHGLAARHARPRPHHNPCPGVQELSVMRRQCPSSAAGSTVRHGP